MEKRIINLVNKICKEHFEITSALNKNNNINYLWFMYTKGTKKNSYKPFVFLAELHLLKYLGFMDENNINNCIKLMESSDKENLFVASQVIQFYRKERIKKLGEFTHTKIKTIRNYSEVLHDYDSEIVNATIWNNKKKLETND